MFAGKRNLFSVTMALTGVCLLQTASVPLGHWHCYHTWWLTAFCPLEWRAYQTSVFQHHKLLCGVTRSPWMMFVSWSHGCSPTQGDYDYSPSTVSDGVLYPVLLKYNFWQLALFNKSQISSKVLHHSEPLCTQKKIQSENISMWWRTMQPLGDCWSQLTLQARLWKGISMAWTLDSLLSGCIHAITTNAWLVSVAFVFGWVKNEECVTTVENSFF